MKILRPSLVLIAVLSCLLTLAPLGAQANPRWHGEIKRFERHDMGHWRGGAWKHGHHNGRLGWWWVVGGAWYFYPQPIYPYPNPYVPSVVVAPQPVVVAPQVYSAPQAAPVAPPEAVAPTISAAPADPQYWYYCDASKTYYPYVATCDAGWRAVPATPPTGVKQ